MGASFVYASRKNRMEKARILDFSTHKVMRIEFSDLTIKSVTINSTIFIGESPPIDREGNNMNCRNCNTLMYFARATSEGYIRYHCQKCGRDIDVRSNVVIRVNNYGRRGRRVEKC